MHGTLFKITHEEVSRLRVKHEIPGVESERAPSERRILSKGTAHLDVGNQVSWWDARIFAVQSIGRLGIGQELYGDDVWLGSACYGLP